MPNFHRAASGHKFRPLDQKNATSISLKDSLKLWVMSATLSWKEILNVTILCRHKAEKENSKMFKTTEVSKKISLKSQVLPPA